MISPIQTFAIFILALVIAGTIMLAKRQHAENMKGKSK